MKKGKKMNPPSHNIHNSALAAVLQAYSSASAAQLEAGKQLNDSIKNMGDTFMNIYHFNKQHKLLDAQEARAQETHESNLKTAGLEQDLLGKKVENYDKDAESARNLQGAQAAAHSANAEHTRNITGLTLYNQGIKEKTSGIPLEAAYSAKKDKNGKISVDSRVATGHTQGAILVAQGAQDNVKDYLSNNIPTLARDTGSQVADSAPQVIAAQKQVNINGKPADVTMMGAQWQIPPAQTTPKKSKHLEDNPLVQLPTTRN